jgi:hypothetical protein
LDVMIGINVNRLFNKLLFLTVVLLMCAKVSFSQPVLPQRTLTVTATQALHFGTFCVKGWPGGSVRVGYDGTRTSSGNIALLAMAPYAQPAIFEIKLCEGRNVIVTFSPTTTLNGSNGGTLTLDVGPTEKGINGASFNTNGDCDYITPLRVGGTLHMPGSTIPGIYTGSFDITFNQE